MSTNTTHLIGIDEVGRGPVAGPVTVCAFVIPVGFDDLPDGIRDSKKLSARRREKFSKALYELAGSGKIFFQITSTSSAYIDKYGIVPAINRALKEALREIGKKVPKLASQRILLDGGLRAPADYMDQETIIGGDDKEQVIAAASILAKVHRDKLMVLADSKYPNWGFARHKGYGTRSHYQALRRHGLCPLHRRSFLTRL